MTTVDCLAALVVGTAVGFALTGAVLSNSVLLGVAALSTLGVVVIAIIVKGEHIGERRSYG